MNASPAFTDFRPQKLDHVPKKRSHQPLNELQNIQGIRGLNYPPLLEEFLTTPTRKNIISKIREIKRNILGFWEGFRILDIFAG